MIEQTIIATNLVQKSLNGKLLPIIDYLKSLEPEIRLQEAIKTVNSLNELNHNWWDYETEKFISFFDYDYSHKEKITLMILDNFLNKLDNCRSGESVMIIKLTKIFDKPKRPSGLIKLFFLFRTDWEYLYPDQSTFDDVHQLFLWIKEYLSTEEISALLDDYIKVGQVEKSVEVANYLGRVLSAKEKKIMFDFLVAEKHFAYLIEAAKLMPEKTRNAELGKELKKAKEEFPKGLSYHFDIASAFTEPKRSAEILKVYESSLFIHGWGAFYRLKYLNALMEPIRSQKIEEFVVKYVSLAEWNTVSLKYLQETISMIKDVDANDLLRKLIQFSIDQGDETKAARIATILPYPESDHTVIMIRANHCCSLWSSLKLLSFLKEPNLGLISLFLVPAADKYLAN